MSTDRFDDPEVLVSVTELEEITGYGRRRIQQLARENRVPKTAHGKYPLGAAVRAIIDDVIFRPPR